MIEDHFKTEEAVESVMAVVGFSFAGRGQNMGMAFVKLKYWELRNLPELRTPAIAARAMKAFAGIKDGMAPQNAALMAVRPNGMDDTPEFKLNLDDVRAGALGAALLLCHLAVDVRFFTSSLCWLSFSAWLPSMKAGHFLLPSC